MKNNFKKILLFLLVFFLGVLVSVLVLSLVGVINFRDNNENINSESDFEIVELDNNVVMVTNSTCIQGCTEKIILSDKKEVDFFASNKLIKLNGKELFSLNGEDTDSIIEQVVVYNDIIISLINYSSFRMLALYDFEGSIIKEINFFNDDLGRLFSVSSGYDDKEMFHVSEDGIISFVGTKYLQSLNNTYITDFSEQINLCDQAQIVLDDDIVSGVFEFSYLGNRHFSEVRYVSLKSTVKDVKTC